MEARNPAELATLINKGQRLLGVDPGAKKIGLALSDPSLTFAAPFSTLERVKFSFLLAELKKIIEVENIGGIIVGLPLNMNGTEGPSAQSARALARNLQSELSMPTAFWDERLSTHAVNRTLLEADISRKGREKVVHKMSAAYILQGALDRINSNT